MTEPAAGRTPNNATDFALRAATAGDAVAIARLHASRFERGWSAGEFSALLADPVVFTLIAETTTPRAGLAGFFSALTTAGEAEILTLAISDRHERAGIGSALTEYACRTAANRLAGSIFLEVAVTNQAALALYARCGFFEAARRPRYYGRGHADDAIVMRRDLRQLVDAEP